MKKQLKSLLWGSPFGLFNILCNIFTSKKSKKSKKNNDAFPLLGIPGGSFDKNSLNSLESSFNGILGTDISDKSNLKSRRNSGYTSDSDTVINNNGRDASSTGRGRRDSYGSKNKGLMIEES